MDPGLETPASAGPTTPGTPERLVLVYDGDCPLCERSTRALVRLGWIGADQRRAYQAYEGTTAEALWNAHIRNEMAVLEPSTGAIRSGFDGILWLLEGSRVRLLVLPFRIPPLRALGRLVYGLVAANRRAIAPPLPAPGGGRLRCACDPDDRPAYQLGFTVLVLAYALAGWLVLERTLGAPLLAWLPPPPDPAAGAPQDGLASWLPGMDDVSGLEGFLAWMATLLGYGLTLPAGRRLRAWPHLAATCAIAITPALVGGPLAVLLPAPLERAAAWLLLLAVVVLPLRAWGPRASYLELDATRARAFSIPLGLATLAGVFFL